MNLVEKLQSKEDKRMYYVEVEHIISELVDKLESKTYGI